MRDYIELTRSGDAPRPTVVIDAVGRCIEDAIAVVADGGRILLFGINSTAAARVNQFEITSRELTIVGSVAASFTMEGGRPQHRIRRCRGGPASGRRGSSRRRARDDRTSEERRDPQGGRASPEVSRSG